MSGGVRGLEPGRIVLSTAGHDKDSFYVVVKWQEGKAYIADGKARKLEKPKAKNPLHLARTSRLLDLGEVTSNRKLWAALRPLNERAKASKNEEGGYGLV